VQAAVQQQHLAFTSAREATLAMSGSLTFTVRADPGRAQQMAKGLASARETFDVAKFFAEVMVVEAGIGGAGQLQDAFPHAIGQAAGWAVRGWLTPRPPSCTWS